jgi:hypothetical protein
MLLKRCQHDVLPAQLRLRALAGTHACGGKLRTHAGEEARMRYQLEASTWQAAGQHERQRQEGISGKQRREVVPTHRQHHSVTS